jgi:transcriptional regulator with XRE-family HTH domain
MILVRRLLGDVLRSRRQRQGRTLREVSGAARVSLGYLSEIERGQKEASSECLAAIGAALGVPLSVLLSEVSDEVAREEAAVVGVTALPAGANPRSASVAGRPAVTNVAA